MTLRTQLKKIVIHSCMENLIPKNNRGELDPFERAVLNRGPGHYVYTNKEKQFGRYLLAIEDASDIAAKCVKNHLRQILNDIRPGIIQPNTLRSSSYVIPGITRGTNKTGNVIERVYHLDVSLGEDGHFAAAITYTNKRVEIFDSMCTHNQQGKLFQDFAAYFYKKGFRNIVQLCPPKGKMYQPSGGFIHCSNNKMNNQKSLRDYLNERGGVGDLNMNRILKYHVFDVMSQHHFCYAEAIVFLCHRLIGTPMGPSSTPTRRLVFIKKVMWGLVHKYQPDTDIHNFPWIVRTTHTNYNSRVNLIVPRKNIDVGFRLEQIDMSGVPNTLKDIIIWAARGT